MEEHESVYSEMIDYHQKKLFKLLDCSVSVMYEQFSSTKIFSKILSIDKHRKEKGVKTFNYKDQANLAMEINTCFASFIDNLKKYCPKLTKKELLLCCLFLRFHPLTISLCMGYSNTNNINAHKKRIKQKMVKLSDAKFLFDFIFN